MRTVTPRPGRPSTITTLDNIERVRLTAEADHRLTVTEIKSDFGIPKTIIWKILTEDLVMTRACVKFILKLLAA